MTDDVFEKNVENLIREGALPLSDARAEKAGRAFVERATRARPHYGGMLTMAAAMMVCAMILWALFGGPGADPAQEADDGMVKMLVADEPATRSAAAASLIKDAEKARPALEKAAKGENPKLARRARAVLALIDALSDAEPPKREFIQVEMKGVGRDLAMNQFGAQEKFVADIAVVLDSSLANVEEIRADFSKREAKFRHIIITEILYGKRTSDFMPTTEFHQRLASEIRARLNAELKSEAVAEVLFTNIRTQ